MKKGDENIDKLFREAFDHREFAFEEAYWNDASKLLAKDNPRLGFWKTAGVAVTGLLVLGSVMYFAFRTDKSENFAASDSLNPKRMEQIDESSSNSTKVLNQSNQNTTENTTTLSATSQAIGEMEKEADFAPGDAPSVSPVSAKYENLSQQQPNNNQSALPVVVPVAANGSLAAQNSAETLPEISSGMGQQVAPQASGSVDVLAIEPASTFAGEEARFNDGLLLMTPKFLLLEEEYSDYKPVSDQREVTPLKRLYIPWTLRLSTGYMWSSNINGQPQYENIAYDMENFNFELSAEYSLRGRWGFQFGVAYSGYKEKQTYQGLFINDESYWETEDKSYWDEQEVEIIVKDSTWWLGGWWNYPPSLDTIIDSTYVVFIDSTYVEKITEEDVNLRESQKIKLIEVPLMVTFNVAHKRWNFQIATGGSLGMFLNSSGKIIERGDPYTTKNSVSEVFNALQYNFLLSTEVGYAIGNNLRLTARPQLKLNLSSMYKNNRQYKPRYLFYGINFGLSYSF